ncbi:MAG: V-type ATP synthase subunit D [Nitrososphaerota archaeon]
MSVSFGGGYLKTKLELIRLRRSVRVAERVYSILEDKRDVLVTRLNELIEQAKHYREQLTELLTDAYLSVQDSYIKIGPTRIESIALTVPETVKIEINKYTMMGIPLPLIEVKSSDIQYSYSISDTSISLDEAVRKMKKIVPILCNAAAAESAIFRVADELKKTQRLLNALEYVVIPRYNSAIQEITMTLDEMERDYFTKLKHIKRLIERRSSTTSLKSS